MGGIICRAAVSLSALENRPAGDSGDKILDAFKGKTVHVHQALDVTQAIDIGLGVQPVVGACLSPRFDQPQTFIIAQTLLGKADHARNHIDLIERIRFLCECHGLQSPPSGAAARPQSGNGFGRHVCFGWMNISNASRARFFHFQGMRMGIN